MNEQRLQNQLHQIALLHTALRHAQDALGDRGSKELKAEIQAALDASESTAPEVVKALLKPPKSA